MPGTAKRSTVERVLNAARELFYSQGYDVSIDKIVEQASVAKPTVYAHFTSKEALVEAVLQAASAEFFDQLDRELAKHSGDPLAQLLTPFDVLVVGLPDPGYRGCLCINAAASFPDPRHPAHAVLRALEERLLEIWNDLAGRAGAKRPDALARQLLLLFDGTKARGLTDYSGAAASDARDAARMLLSLNRQLKR